MSDLPWPERVSMLSIHPEAATREDVARLAADLTTWVERAEKIEAEAARYREALEIIAHNKDGRYNPHECQDIARAALEGGKP